MENKTNREIHQIKEKLIDLLYWIFTIVMWFALAGSIYRTIDLGIKPLNYIHLFLVVIFLTVFIFRKKIKYYTKTWVLLITLYILGSTALFSFGLLSQGIYVLLLFSILTGALINQKWGIISFSASIFTLCISATLFLTGKITNDNLIINYSQTFSAWVMAILIFTISSWIIFIFWERILSLLVTKVEVSLIHENTLNRVNKLLSKEIESRKTAEQLLQDHYLETKTLNKEYQMLNKQLQEANERLERSNQIINEAKQKAQTADKLKSSFLSNMSHEIRTPMNAIVGFATLIGNDEISKEDKHNYVSIIQSSTNGLLNTISDIITMARIESGEFTLYPSTIDLNKFINELNEEVNHNLTLHKNDKIKLIFENNINDQSIIISDIESLNQITRKLIDNALKFTEKGSIRIAINLSENGFLNFQIEDTGIGILDDNKSEIYEVFRQIDSGNTRKYGGMGIGLSIARGLIELLNGTIEFTSIPSKGTIFNLAIPIIKQSINNNITPHQLQIQLKGKTILIIGKYTWENRSINQYLQEINSILIYVESGFQAIDTIKEHPEINLVIMSMFLPDMNGYEVAKILKKSAPKLSILAHLPLGKSDANLLDKKSGWDDYIESPIEKNDFLTSISRYLISN